MRVALVHDWLTGMRGGEKVLEALCGIYPQAEVFTLLADSKALSPTLSAMQIHTSWMQNLPGVKQYYRKLLPWMPGAIERFNLTGFDLVISSSHCVAKGVKAPAGVPHLCYCHTPMRYAWHLRELYLEKVPAVARSWARSQLDRLREWDRTTSSRVTQFIANGKTVQQRIKEVYGRESIVIHPPVDVDFYVPDPSIKREDYYLVVSALAPNKRTDLAIGACQKLGRRLVIIGTGEEERKLSRLAGTETTFLGWATNETVRDHLQRCRALLFSGEEDFGIVPIEAQACGTSVIVYGVGGATETVVPLGEAKPTGVWFGEARIDSLAAAMQRFETEGSAIRSETCRANAEQYGAERFRTSMEQAISSCLK
ncbi:MAG TPA: glycosyltransferase [Gemmatales bacterium]|nr:glycosyltransferase [Gemmatales bacterium]